MSDALNIPGITEAERVLLGQCLKQLDDSKAINGTRRRYFEAKQYVQHLGIAIPPQLQNFETALGWPYKAVKALASRVKFDGFAVPGAEGSAFGIDRLWADNKLGIESHHAHMSALTYGVSFVAVLAGGAGEPEVVIRALSPLTTTALWDANRRRAYAAVTVTESDAGNITELIFFLEDKVVTSKFDGSRWVSETVDHSLGRCPVVMISYDSSPEYPFGRSRISQGVMRITDEAIRTSLRMEVSAEFYSSPQRYILGADEKAFIGPDGRAVDAWSAITGRALVLSNNEENDEKPTVGQFQQMTMQPHVDMFRMIAAKFSGETSLPTHTLGLIGDNPDSEEAIKAKYLELAADAESAHEPFGSAWVDAIRMAVQIRDGVVPEGLDFLSAKWRNPMYESKSAQGDMIMKMVQVGVLPPESEVVLEMLGFDQLTIDRVVADRRSAGVSTLVDRILNNQQASPNVVDAQQAGSNNQEA